jgi:DNA-binding response OmpR family regulator
LDGWISGRSWWIKRPGAGDYGAFLGKGGVMTNILVVDDEPVYRAAIAIALGNDHLHVDAASSADEAIDIARRNIPDVLIADWMLGGDRDGFDVVEALRALNPQVHVMVITASPSDALRKRAAGFSAIRCLFKPFSLSQFREALRPWLE